MSDFVNTVDIVGDEALAESIINRSITEIFDSNVVRVGDSAFKECTPLETANFSAAVYVGNGAFYNCTSLTTLNLPIATTFGDSATFGLSALKTVNLPAATTFGGSSFSSCRALTAVDLPVVTSIREYSFGNCTVLTAVIIRNTNSVCSLGGSSFTSTPIKSGTGYIYVPAALVDSYKTATNWSTFATQFRALEDYTVDGTTTGALDPNKI